MARKSTTSSEVKRRYNKKAYDNINLSIPKGRRDEIRAHLEGTDMTVNKFLNECIRKELGVSEEDWKTYIPD